MMVPQTSPASRVIVEKRAAAKASTRPTMASRNRTQTWESLSRGKRDGAEESGSFWTRSEITWLVRPFPLVQTNTAGRCFYQHMTAAGLVEVTEETMSGEADPVKTELPQLAENGWLRLTRAVTLKVRSGGIERRVPRALHQWCARHVTEVV